LKEINTFIQQGCIKLINSDSKDIYNVTKISISNKCCFCYKNVKQFGLTTVLNIDNN